MSMKTKDRCGELADEAGMLLKTNHLAKYCGNVVENKGS